MSSMNSITKVEQLKREGEALGIPKSQLNAWAEGGDTQGHIEYLQRLIDEQRQKGSAA